MHVTDHLDAPFIAIAGLGLNDEGFDLATAAALAALAGKRSAAAWTRPGGRAIYMA